MDGFDDGKLIRDKRGQFVKARLSIRCKFDPDSCWRESPLFHNHREAVYLVLLGKLSRFRVHLGVAIFVAATILSCTSSVRAKGRLVVDDS
jgi:hypothetical protein